MLRQKYNIFVEKTYNTLIITIFGRRRFPLRQFCGNFYENMREMMPSNRDAAPAIIMIMP